MKQPTWTSPFAVRYYRQLRRLQPPEAAALEKLRPTLSTARMLDIGIGGGRTTAHFAPLVFEYVGIDASEPMVRACRKRFSDNIDTGHFEVCDARDLSPFRDGMFDLVLFSYNGLDYIDQDGRLKALREIRRVARKGARFLFSSHNLESLRRRRLWRLWRNNPPLHEVLARDWAIVNDGAFLFTLSTYYIRPEAQIAQLQATGFGDVEMLSAQTDPWVYYLTTAV